MEELYGRRLRRTLARGLRRVGAPHPRDLGVWLARLGRAPLLHVPVLAYHRIEDPAGRPDDEARYCVAPAVFEAQMEYLARGGYRTIFAGELSQRCAESRSCRRSRSCSASTTPSRACARPFPRSRSTGTARASS